MATYRFAEIEVLLAESQSGGPQPLRGTLAHVGLTRTRVIADFAEIEHRLASTRPDLVICDTDFPGGDVCGLCRAVRHNDIGSNPFVPVIDIAGAPTADVVRRVIESGADDLVAKPLTADRLLERIVRLIEARRPFVVTSDYIGPDRRQGTRVNGAIPLLEVPNVLRMKASGDQEALANLDADIATALVLVNRERLRQCAYRVAFLTTLISRIFEQQRVRGAFITPLEELLDLARDLARRAHLLAEREAEAACRRLVAAGQRVHDSVRAPEPKDVAALSPLSMAIHRLFHPEVSDERLDREMAYAVNQYLSRTGRAGRG